jgi:hypothetical protein
VTLENICPRRERIPCAGAGLNLVMKASRVGYLLPPTLTLHDCVVHPSVAGALDGPAGMVIDVMSLRCGGGLAAN